MNTKELVPGRKFMSTGRGRIPHNGEIDPFLLLHREMNRLFDDAFHDLFETSGAMASGHDRTEAWPTVEVEKTDKEIRVMAELPGIDEKDVRVELTDNVLIIDGERKSQIDDRDRWFSERYYGHFERRIPLDWEVEEDKAAASFRNGVLTVTLPKSAKEQEHTKRIAVNGN